mmetsp:Transcript_95684/g.279800  ORF Transcript_95684/g.279800 Transcript_95684/m.279800 type:complete len:237 (-) Transcript_95684:932-1642(-)
MAGLLQHRPDGVQGVRSDGAASNICLPGRAGAPLRQHPAVARFLLGVRAPQPPQQVQQLAPCPLVPPLLPQRLQAALPGSTVGVVRGQPADPAEGAVEDGTAEAHRGVPEVHYRPEDHCPDRGPHLPPLLRALLGLLSVRDEERGLHARGVSARAHHQAALLKLLEEQGDHLPPEAAAVHAALVAEHHAPLAQERLLGPFSHARGGNGVEDRVAREHQRLVHTTASVLLEQVLRLG